MILDETIKLIKDHKKSWNFFKPNSEISLIENYFDKIDLVLIMSVEPGFGGQKFMPEVLKKLKEIKKIILKKIKR